MRIILIIVIQLFNHIGLTHPKEKSWVSASRGLRRGLVHPGPHQVCGFFQMSARAANGKENDHEDHI